jgi:hypothetical protein
MVNQRTDTMLISRGSVIRYLRDLGWQRQVSRDGRVVRLALAEQEGSDPVNLFFSLVPAPEIERSEVAAAIETLSQLYEQAPMELARKLSALPYDLIFGRIPNEYVKHESVELRLATSYMSSMKGFLAASATTELSGGQKTFKRTRKEALEYAGRCRFGHTYRGSFGFLIESPVGLNDEPVIDSVAADVPFERKVMQRIVRGLLSYNDAVAEEDPSSIAVTAGGMSANMCDEIVGVLEDTGVSKIDLSVQLSPEWKSHDVVSGNAFVIEAKYVDLLKDAADRMRKSEPPHEAVVVGRVVRLEAEGDPSDLVSDRSNRDITISWDSPDYGLARVQVALPPEEYLEAVRAHSAGAVLSVTGTLKRQGRSWTLESPASLRRLE